MDQVRGFYILFKFTFLIPLIVTTTNSESSIEATTSETSIGTITSYIPTESTNVSMTSSTNTSKVTANVPNVFSTRLSPTTHSPVSPHSNSRSTELNAASITYSGYTSASDSTFQITEITSSPVTSGATTVPSTTNLQIVTKLDTVSGYSMVTTFKENLILTNQTKIQATKTPLTILTPPGTTPFTSALTHTTTPKVSKNTSITGSILPNKARPDNVEGQTTYDSSSADPDAQTTTVLEESTSRRVTTSTKSDQSSREQTVPVPDNGAVAVLSTMFMCALTVCCLNLLL